MKSPFVETTETVNLKLRNISDIEGVGPKRVIGGTDYSFEVQKNTALQKLKFLAEGLKLNEK